MGSVVKRMIAVSAGLILLAAAVCIFCRGTRSYTQWEQEHIGVPDVVSSRTDGDECMLIVVANADSIEDEQAFAEETVRKYEENEFYTTRFSRDHKSLPKQVYMSVYLRKSDIGQKPSVFSIMYDTENRKIRIIQ